RDRAENGVVAAEHCGRAGEIAPFNSGANGGAAYNRSVHFHRRDSDNIEVMPTTEFAQERKVAAPVFSERPFVADTNFTQRLGALGQLGNEIFRLGLREIFVERNYQQMGNPKSADQSDFVWCRSDEMRRILGPQNLGRMRIE